MASTGVTRIEGVDPAVAIKAPCVVATTANITLSGAQTIDGVAVAETTVPTRVLVRNQTDGAENGIYDVKGTAWVRSEDWDGNRDVVKGTAITVTSGTSFPNTTFKVQTSDPITIGSTAVVFSVRSDNDTAKSVIGTYALLRTALADGDYVADDIVTVLDPVGPHFKIEAIGSNTDDSTTVITGGSFAAVREYNGQIYADWGEGSPGTGGADDSTGINLAFAAAASTDGKALAFSPLATYNITGPIGRTSGGDGGTINEIYANGAEINYTGTGTALEFATDAPSITGRLRIVRDTVGASQWEDQKPGATYEGTVGISVKLMRSKVWEDVYIEGFSFPCDFNLSGSVSDRITRCRIENIEFSACLNGFNVFCANDGWMTEMNFVDCRYAGATMKKGNYTITGATQANPVVVTAVGHDFVNGEIVEHESVGGMTEINGEFTAQNVTANTYELYTFTSDTTVTSTAVDGTGYTAYTSGGEAFALQGTFFRGYNDGSASSDAFPRALKFDSCVIERAKYAIRHNANGAGNVSDTNFFENCPYNIHLEDINNNPNCNWDVFGDADQSGEVISTIDEAVQSHTVFGNRDIWIKSFISLINSVLGFEKRSSDLTAKGLVYEDGQVEVVNTTGDSPLVLGQTASGARDFIQLYRGTTQIGEIGIDASDNLVVRNFGANDIIVDAASGQSVQIQMNGVLKFQFDDNVTAGNTGLNVYSNSASALRRIKQDTAHGAPGGGDYLYIDA